MNQAFVSKRNCNSVESSHHVGESGFCFVTFAGCATCLAGVKSVSAETMSETVSKGSVVNSDLAWVNIFFGGFHGGCIGMVGFPGSFRFLLSICFCFFHVNFEVCPGLFCCWAIVKICNLLHKMFVSRAGKADSVP